MEKQRRFSRTITAEDHDAFSPVYHEIETAHMDLGCVRVYMF
jgi:hypothetical protein